MLFSKNKNYSRSKECAAGAFVAQDSTYTTPCLIFLTSGYVKKKNNNNILPELCYQIYTTTTYYQDCGSFQKQKLPQKQRKRSGRICRTRLDLHLAEYFGYKINPLKFVE